MDLMTAATMDSREIAERTGKDHAHVCRDIAKILEEMGEGGESRFGSSYLSEQNKSVKCYRLPKRECLILASGYSVKLRAAIIDRWIELESAATPRTFSQALRLAAEQQEAIEYAQAQLEAQRPAVEFVQHFVEAKQTQPLRVVAKVLKVQERKFVAALLEHGVLYRIGGKLTPSAEHMEAERFEIKELVVNGDRATTQMRFTPKGVEWIARKVQEWELTA